MTINISEFYFRHNLNSCVASATISMSGTYSINANAADTLTNDGVLKALVVDGVTVNVNDRICFSKQGSQFKNGIYTVKDAGSSVTPWILERSQDFRSLGQMKVGMFFTIDGGNTNVGDVLVVSEVPNKLGVDSLLFSEAEANITDASLLPVKAAPSFVNAAAGAFPMYFRARNSGGASENVDLTIPYDVIVIDIICVLRANGSASDTVTVSNLATGDISNAMDVSGAVNTVVRPTTLSPSNHRVDSAQTLRIAYFDSAGNDMPAIDVVVNCVMAG